MADCNQGPDSLNTVQGLPNVGVGNMVWSTASQSTRPANVIHFVLTMRES